MDRAMRHCFENDENTAKDAEWKPGITRCALLQSVLLWEPVRAMHAVFGHADAKGQWQIWNEKFGILSH